MSNILGLKSLGKSGATFSGLETFHAPAKSTKVRCISDEVTALCPVTGQPDWYVVDITYRPNGLCVESKSLKLFLQSFRNAGHFCEDFSQIICNNLNEALDPKSITVTVIQKPRGGVSIEATSEIINIP
jgi:7-cyano-7-deazaguanine reductase